MAIQEFGAFYETELRQDENGNPIVEIILNEEHQVLDNRFPLNEIPDPVERVQITGLSELTDPNSAITTATQFKVDYDIGFVTVHSSLEGTTVTVARYGGRGGKLLFDNRVRITDEGNDCTSTTLSALTGEIRTYIDTNNTGMGNDITALQTRVTTAEGNITTNTGNIATNASTIANLDSDDIANASSVTGNNVSEALETISAVVENITTGDSNASIGVYSVTDNTNTNGYVGTVAGLTYFGGLKVNLTTSNTNTGASTLNINSLGATSIKIRQSDGTKVDLPASSISGIAQLEYDGTDFVLINGKSSERTDTLTVTSSIFSTATGMDTSDANIDVNSTVVEGNVGDLILSGNTNTNIITNGGFRNGTTNWVGSSATLSVSSNTLSVTGDGTNINTQARQTINQLSTGNRVYFRYLARVTNTDAIRLRLGTDITALFDIVDPVQNQWYVLHVVRDIASDTELRVQATYPDTTIANGSVMEVQEVFAINMGTSSSDPLYDLTADQMNERFPYWFDGTKSTLDHRIKSVGKNLFDPNGINTNGTDLVVSDISSNSFSIENPTTTGQVTHDIAPSINFKENAQYNFSGTSIETVEAKNLRLIIVYTDGTEDNIFLPNTTETNFNTISDSEKTIARISFRMSQTGDGKTTIRNFQVEEGSSATTFESYQESISYIQFPDGEELRSIPNETTDEVNVEEGLWYKRVSDDTALTSISFAENLTNNRRSRIRTFKEDGTTSFVADESVNLFNSNGIRIEQVNVADRDLVGNQGKYYVGSDGIFLLTAVDVIPTVNHTLNFQLALSIQSNLSTTPLQSYNKGTITIEPILREQSQQNEGILLKQPVQSIEVLEQYLSGSNSYQILDTSDATIYRLNSTDTTESGTTTTNITLTGHGLVVGDRIYNTTRDAIRRVTSVPDVDNITVNAVTAQTNGDTIKTYKTTITDTTQEAIIAINTNADEIYRVEYSYPTELTTIPTFAGTYPLNSEATILDNNSAINRHSSQINDINDQIINLYAMILANS